MKRFNHSNMIFLAFFLLAFIVIPASAFYDVIPSGDYQFPDGEDLPEALNLYQDINCGNYALRINYPPLITKSMNAIVGDYDLSYLVLRVGITNNNEETVGWLAPDSFVVSEVFRNRIYGTYQMDPLMSAKSAKGYSQSAFYTPILPGATLQTFVVFDVFPDAEGWIITFAPHVFGEEPEAEIKFMLPQVYYQ